MINNYKIKLENVTKTFGRRLIFRNINFEFHSGKVYGLAGRNGSGKSTLAKIIIGVAATTSGKIVHTLNEKIIIEEKLHEQIGFVSPYLVLYDEFSAYENLVHTLKIRGKLIDEEKINYWLNEFNLFDRRNDLLKGYSSGMKQRMKFIFALVHEPEFLLFDEPTSNLDNTGKEKVYQIIDEQLKNKCVIIASNEDNDLALCRETLKIEEFKN